MIKQLGRYQVYVDRSKQYVGTLTLFIQISLFISINVGLELLWWQYLAVFILAPFIFLIAGYFDVKMGILSQVQGFYTSKHPGFIDISKQLEQIKEKLNALELENNKTCKT